MILKLNCWISSKGISENRFTFPYKARCSSGFKEFNNKNDVWDEILKIAYETEKAGFDAIGESCYFESLYFANNSDLIDPDSQIGKEDIANISDIYLESAISTIMDWGIVISV